MKSRRFKIMIISLILAMSTCTTAYAQIGKIDKVYTANDVVYESHAPKPLVNSSARAIWVTYPKTIYLDQWLEGIKNPQMSDFPQSVSYSEPNPSGYGDDAKGTLYLNAVSKNKPNDPYDYGYRCSYTGTMGYFLF